LNADVTHEGVLGGTREGQRRGAAPSERAQHRRGRTAAGLLFALITVPCCEVQASIPKQAARPAATATSPSTLARVRDRRELLCGVVVSTEDWNKSDLHGPLTPLDIEMCKAVGVTVLGDAVKVDVTTYHSESDAERGLNAGKVDLVVGVTPTASAMAQGRIKFGPPILYDGLSVLVRKDGAADTLEDLKGRDLKMCVIDGTDNEPTLFATLKSRHIDFVPVTFQEEGEMDDALAVGYCDAVGAYVSQLVRLRDSYPKQLGSSRILPRLLSLSPVVPAYRGDDAQWGMIVDWTVYALVQAEASGINHANVLQQQSNEDPTVLRLVGTDWATSQALGLLPAKDWSARLIAVMGNYGEIYDRTVGPASALGMPRGVNALWTDGGLMHPMPLQ
jgi:general L-amino acid transport system substrate-binding protein